jgi:hypothetical protein
LRASLLLALTLGWVGAAQAAVVVADNFNFSGALTSNGWTAISGVGIAVINTGTGLSYTSLPSSGVGNAAVINSPITSGGTGEDLRKVFPSGITSGSIYTSFLINLTSATSGGDYFFAAYSSATSGGGFNGRIFAKASGAGYVLGLTKSSTTVYDTTVRNFNTTYLVVLKNQISATTTTDDNVSIWVDPALASSEGTALLNSNAGNDITAVVGFDGVVIRQGSGTPAGKIDSILVGTTWADVTPGAAVVPTITTSSSVSAISSSGATLGGSISSTGGANATETGIFYSTISGFVNGTGTKVSATELNQGTGAFTQIVTGLSQNTTYYFKAFASNSAGSGYGTEQSFITTVQAQLPPSVTAAPIATVDSNIEMTFTENASYSAAVTGIKVGGASLPVEAFSTLSAGKIVLSPSASSLLQSSGSKIITITATGYEPLNVTQAISHGVATKLGILTQAVAPAANGGAFATQPVVAVQDQYGNTVLTSTETVTAAVGSGDWILGGTVGVAAVNGVANFSGLKATKVGSVTGATISFSAVSLVGVTSVGFDLSLPLLSITAPSSIYEGDNTQIGTVTIPFLAPSDITVTLASSSGTDLQVDGDGNGFLASTTVVIYTGTSESQYYLSAPSDGLVDSTVLATLTASAANFANGTRPVNILNADVTGFSLTDVNGTYTQNFDSLGATSSAAIISATIGSQTALSAINASLAGWFGTKLAGNGATATAVTADTGALTSGLIYSYGSAAAIDRALGSLASGSNTMGFGALFKNETGVVLQSVTITYTGEYWKDSTSLQNVLAFAYGKVGAALNGNNFLTSTAMTAWVSANLKGPQPVTTQVTLDGNLSANRKSITLSLPITLNPGESFVIRWQDVNESGNDAGLAVDDFSMTVSTQPPVFTAPTLGDVSADEAGLLQTQATVGSEVTGDGGTVPTQIGFVYSVSTVNPNPLIGGTGVILSANATPAVGIFSNILTSLAPSTSYSVKAFAVNSAGTNYSPVKTITTPAPNPVFSGEYRQSFANFTSKENLPVGWKAFTTANFNSYAGSWDNLSASLAGFYGRASAVGVLGYLHTSASGTLNNKLTLVNGTGGALTSLWISYTGEVNLTSNGRFPEWAVALNDSTITALAYSTSSGTSAWKSAEITGLNIPDGASFSLSWVSDRGLTGTGSSRMIGLTGVRVATTEPSAPPIISGGLTMAGTVGVQVTPYQISASGSATSYSAVGLPDGLAVNPVTGEITGTPTAVTPVSGSIVQIVASNGGGDGSANLLVTIAKGSSSVTVTGSTSFTFNGSPQGPATANVSGSTGVVAYSYSGFGSTTYGPLATPPTNAGSYVVTASVVADTSYNGASSSATSFTITKATPTITADPTASTPTAGQALSTSVLSGGTASVAGAFAWTAPSTVPSVGTASYGVTFTPTDTVNYTTAATTVSLTVNSVGTTYRSWLGAASPSDASFWDYVYGATAPGALPASLRPTVTVTGGSLVLTYYVRQNAIGLTVTPKASADLAAGQAGWSTDGVSILAGALTTAENGVSVQRHAASVTVSGVKQFLRTEAVEQ